MSTPDLPEILEILDDQGKIIGSMTRQEAEAANHATPNVLIFIFNSRGEVWAQLRPKTKAHFPGVWDISACGGIIKGETPEQAAKRELLEEMGITCPLRHVETFINAFPGHGGQTFRRLSHLYLGISDDQPQTNAEVDEFKALPHAQLRADVQAHPEAYVPSFLTELDIAVAAYLAQSAQP